MLPPTHDFRLVAVAAHPGTPRYQGYIHLLVDGSPACPTATTGTWTAFRLGAVRRIPTLTLCPWPSCFAGEAAP